MTLDLFMNMLMNAGYVEHTGCGECLPKEFHIYKEKEYEGSIRNKDGIEIDFSLFDVIIIKIGEGYGNLGTYVEFIFDKDGKFLTHGIWE